MCSRCPVFLPSPLLLAGFQEAGFPHQSPNSPLPGTGATKTGNFCLFVCLALGVRAAKIVEWGKFLILFHSQLECLITTSLGGPPSKVSFTFSAPWIFTDSDPESASSTTGGECGSE